MVVAGCKIVWSCELVGVARSTYYRIVQDYQHYQPVVDPVPQRERFQPAALTQAERDNILEVLTRNKYATLSVGQVFWRAFDRGEVACSERTFYRVANAEGLVGDRRRVRGGGGTGRSSRRKPHVHATRPGQMWSWDVTEFRGPNRQDRYMLYLVIDVFSRFPVAWRIEYTTSDEMAVEMFAEAIAKYGVPEVVHSDNGATMRSHALVDALVEQGVVMSYSRPRVSEDNPFSEALFKTIKYDLHCPDRFTSIEHAREWTGWYLPEYATEHRHRGLNRYTPGSVFDGTMVQVQAARQVTLDADYLAHPERYRQRPLAPKLPGPTGINVNPKAQPKNTPSTEACDCTLSRAG